MKTPLLVFLAILVLTTVNGLSGYRGTYYRGHGVQRYHGAGWHRYGAGYRWYGVEYPW